MKSTEAAITELLNLSKGIICHVFTKLPEKMPVYSSSTNASGHFEATLAIPGGAFPIDKQRTRTFTATATQKQVAEKWAALFGCLELKKESVFPEYAAQFLHILRDIEDSVVPFYNELCKSNLENLKPPAKPKNKQQQTTTSVQATEVNQSTNTLQQISNVPIITANIPSTTKAQQFETQKLEDHQILRKPKKRPITDTPDEIFEFRIRSKSDLAQLGELDCVCRFCKTPLCSSSELTIDVFSIWCDAKQITTQISELLENQAKISSLNVHKMTPEEIDTLCTTKTSLEFSCNPQKTQKTLPFLVHCKNCHEHIGVLELPVGSTGRVQLTRDTICFAARELVNGKRVLIGTKTWKKLQSQETSTSLDLAKKSWFVYNVKIPPTTERYPHLNNQFLFSYFIFCAKPLFSSLQKEILHAGQLALSEEEILTIRKVDANLQGGIALMQKPAKSDKWHAYIVPEFVADEKAHTELMDASALELLLRNCEILLESGNALDIFNTLISADKMKLDEANSYFRNRIVRTPYNNRAYAISCINFSLNPLSNIPHSKVTFKEYYTKKGTPFCDDTQPMIEIDMLSEYMSKEKGFKKFKRDGEDRYVHLVPELSELTGFTQELKGAAKIYKQLVPPAWKQRKFDRSLEKFENKIGITWENKEIIAQAFDFTTQTHQRIEFLGDSVLDFVVSVYYFIKKPFANESKLTLQRSNKVSNSNLSKLALDLNLLKCMPECQDRLAKLLANVLEAVIGAIFLDKGLYQASKFVCVHVLSDPAFCDTLFTKFVPPPHYEQCMKPSETIQQLVPQLESAIGYSFQNKTLLYQAITHPTVFNDNHTHPTKEQIMKLTKQEINKEAHLDYERFEFLGDMLIKFFVGVYFYFNKPSMTAGDLSFLRHIYVMNEYFSQQALKLQIPDLMIKPDNFSLPLSSSHSYLGDVLEAITCAIYLDSVAIDPLWKGFQSASPDQTSEDGNPAANFVCTMILKGMSQEDEDARMEMIRAKNALQSHYHKLGPNTIKYLELPKPSDSVFHVGVYVNAIMVGQGKGTNKQTAEKMAALDALRACNIQI